MYVQCTFMIKYVHDFVENIDLSSNFGRKWASLHTRNGLLSNSGKVNG